VKFLSVCSGIEAASVAWSGLGWKASAFAEIEAFPSAVLAHHYPSVPNLGDMTKIARGILTGEVEAPDLLCGGTPCQAFSVAGLRASLGDARGGLTLKFAELADAIDFVRARSGRPPSIVFWENVPGVLNTKDNAFGCFLGALVGESEALEPSGEKWTDAGCVYGPTRAVAWRVLDAQYFGLAQRRRRVFVVASARNGFDPAEVLFERDGLRRDSAPSRGAGQDVAGRAPFGPALQCGCGHIFAEKLGAFGCPNCEGDDGPAVEITAGLAAYGGGNTGGSIGHAATLTANRGCHNPGDFEAGTLLVQQTAHTLRGEGFDASEDGTGRGTPLVPVTVATLDARTNGGGFPGTDGACGGHVIPVEALAGALQANGKAAGSATQQDAESGLLVPMAFDTTQITSAANRSNPQAGDPCHPLAAGAHPPAIAFPANLSGTQHASTGDLAPSMGAKNPTGVAYTTKLHNTQSNQAGKVYEEYTTSLDRSSPPPALLTAMQVRRLTPVECERLQGFPDGYTAIPWRKKPASECPDGPRYKALGNSWAVPVVAWIGRRIDAVLERLEPA